MKIIGHRIRRLSSLSKLCNWWKNRRFQYRVHANLTDDSIAKELRGRCGKDGEHGSTATCDSNRPLAYYLEDSNTRETSELVLNSSASTSFYGSIGSLDSADDSQHTHSQEHIFEIGFDKFLMAHLEFLSQSTQPQEVELVYQTH